MMFEFSDVGEYKGFLSELNSQKAYGAVVVVKERKSRESLYEVEITLPPQYDPRQYPQWLFSKRSIPSSISVSRKLLDGVCLIGCTLITPLPDSRDSEGCVDARAVFEGNIMKLSARAVVDTYDDATIVAGVRRQYEGLDAFFRNGSARNSSYVIGNTGGLKAAITDTSDLNTQNRNLFLQTSTDDASLWIEHFSTHNSFKNLLSVSLGKPSKIIGREESITHYDPIHGHSWDRLNRSPAVIESKPIPDPALFTMNDLSDDWFEKWNTLTTDYSRGIYAYLALLDRKDKLHVETACIHFGTVLEFIGHIAEEKGLKQGTSLASHVKYIYDTVPRVEGLTNKWKKTMADTYNKTKHIDPKVISADQMINNTAIGMEIVRMWIAVQLGVSDEVLKQYYHLRGGIFTNKLIKNNRVF